MINSGIMARLCAGLAVALFAFGSVNATSVHKLSSKRHNKMPQFASFAAGHFEKDNNGNGPSNKRQFFLSLFDEDKAQAKHEKILEIAENIKERRGDFLERIEGRVPDHVYDRWTSRLEDFEFGGNGKWNDYIEGKYPEGPSGVVPLPPAAWLMMSALGVLFWRGKKGTAAS